MNTPGEGPDLLDAYLQEVLARLGREGFEVVLRAADVTCELLAGGHPTLLAGPDDDAFGHGLQREYLALLAVLITGRTDHHIITLPQSDGTASWAVVEDHLLHDPKVLEELRTRLTARAHETAQAARALEQWWTTD
ncbi:hypothetical protein [Streptomyces sp. NBC_01264]|uniref:hypothetical protein n=1 Tax=Streptomyces sp. NBC_01264 TaxID=2903804 RepID=UPI00225109FA|nr:hypothetical protein [Streptomyces sp. NBC_01264]MCX4782730.1 hypothetical protein [Streptomyces sp. NBC_01264]